MMPLGELLIDVHRLAVLREVARAGSFAGAAAALHHTPSAVSQQIAALERGAGIVLVERSTRGVILTEAGRALLVTADAIHAELQLAAQRLRALAADGPQALTVVTFPSAGEPLLAPSLTAMTAAVGDPVEITVIEAEPDEALGAVRDGRADLALVYHFHTAAPPRGWPAAAGTGTYVHSPLTRYDCWFPQATRWPFGRVPAWPRSLANAGFRAGAMSAMSPTCSPRSAVSVFRSPAAPATTAS
jgi:DNA-binding transcriptional LysR family regulator